MKKALPYDVLNGLVILVTFVVILYAPYRIDHDAAWFLHVGRMIQRGAVPYIDYVVVNFPMIQYLSILPVWLAEVFDISAGLVFLLMVFALSVFSTLMLRYLLGRTLGHTAAVIGLVASLITLHYKATRYYGQREHIFILLFLPGFALRLLRWQGKTPPHYLAVILGALAAVGVCIKPHFLLVALAPELYWLAVHRHVKPLFTPEVITFSLVGIAYLLHPYLIFPTYAAQFYPSLLENALFYYEYWDSITLLEIIFSPNGIIGLAGAAIAFAIPYSEVHIRQFVHATAVLTIGAVLAYIAQRRGFTYQFIPAVYGLLILFTMYLFRLSNISRHNMPLLSRVAIGIPIVAITTMLFVDFRQFLSEHRVLSLYTPQLHTLILEASQPGDEIIFLGFDFHRYTDFTVLELWQDHRYPVAYPILFEARRLQMAGTAITTESMITPVTSIYLDNLLADIDRVEPDLLIISDEIGCGGFCSAANLSLRDILTTRPAFTEVLQREYAFSGESDGYQIFRRQAG